MRISNMGEDRVVEIITAQFTARKKIPLGIGDDCAVVNPPPKDQVQLLKTDAIVEGIHFTANTPAKSVGRKALARVLSDFAAMGATPEYGLVTMGLPGETDIRKVSGIAQGIGVLAQEFDLTVVGGETVRTTGPLFVSIAGTGRCPRGGFTSRSGAKSGHYIYVTGELGNSIRGHHLKFIPRLREGQWLVRNFQPSAMMDLSDGLGTDLPRLAASSKVGFDIDDSMLPLRRGADTAAAWKDGEDYELLFTLPKSRAETLEKKWNEKFPDTRLSLIGRITPAAASVQSRGFDHFSQT